MCANFIPPATLINGSIASNHEVVADVIPVSALHVKRLHEADAERAGSLKQQCYAYEWNIELSPLHLQTSTNLSITRLCRGVRDDDSFRRKNEIVEILFRRLSQPLVSRNEPQHFSEEQIWAWKERFPL